MFNAVLKKIGMRKRGRVVDCTGLENRQRETVREFESHRFRQNDLSGRFLMIHFLIFLLS